MKILFIYNGFEQLGLEYLSSFLKSHGHEVFLCFDPAVFSGDQLINNKFFARFTNLDEKILEKVSSINPDLVAFSTFTGNYLWCLNLAQKIKKQRDVPIVFGGIHATAVPKRVLSHSYVDFVIAGEGEHVMLDLLSHLKEQHAPDKLLEIPNLCFRYKDKIVVNPVRSYIQDLDALPFPDKKLFYDKVPFFQKSYLIMTSRGCPHNCSYCCNSLYRNVYCHEKKHMRRRSPQNVLEELVQAKKKWKMQMIVFSDDEFSHNEEWLREFLKGYKEYIQLPFHCFVNPLNVSDQNARMLKEAGCWLVTMGVQSGSERLRKEVFSRGGSNKRILQSFSYLKKYDMKVSVDNIFGAVGEGKEDLQKAEKLYDYMKYERILTFWLTYYPQTPIVELAKKEGVLSEQDVDNIENGHIGFTHSYGSIQDKEMITLYNHYDVIFQLRALFHNDKLYFRFKKVFSKMPFKKVLARMIFLLNVIKMKDKKFFYFFQYFFAPKKVP